MLTAPVCEATQRMQRVFCPPVAVNAAGNSSPVDSGGGRYLRLLRGVGASKNPLDPLAPLCPAPGPSRPRPAPQRSPDWPAAATPAPREYDPHAPPAGVPRRPLCAPEAAPA